MQKFTETRIFQRRWATPSVLELILEAVNVPFLEAAPGAHVDVHLSDGNVRQYSLVDPVPAGSHHCRIGIKVLADGRGGSLRIAEELQSGTRVLIGMPRNLFALVPAGTRPVVLVAGGIGITPIHAMATVLRQTPNARWTMHYSFSRREDAYIPSDWLLQDQRVTLHPSYTETSQPVDRLDLEALVRNAVVLGGADIYCCGPQALMDALEQCCEAQPGIRYFRESFEAPDLTPDGNESTFEVTLERSGRCLRVPADRTILDVLRDAGVAVPSSCEQGICGACETRVLAGTPVHRDAILSPAEQASGKSMMICCSRAATPGLVLDL